MNYNPIIVALDFDSFEESKLLIDNLGSSIEYYKVGSQLFVGSSDKILNYLISKHKKIFLDLKFHDIPNTVKKAVYQSCLKGIDMLTIHLSGGSQMIKYALDGKKQANAKTNILGVSVLTSISQEVLNNEIKVNLSIADYIDNLVKIGLKNNINGIVCSAMETKIMREKFGNDFLIINPGIRLKEDSTDDQKRIATPDTAINDGANYIVVGRSITKANNPIEKVKKYRQILNIT